MTERLTVATSAVRRITDALAYDSTKRNTKSSSSSSKDDSSFPTVGSIGLVLAGASAAACLTTIGYYSYYSVNRRSANKKTDGTRKKNHDRKSDGYNVGDWGKPKRKKAISGNNTNEKDDDDDNTSSSSSSSYELPQHIQRELYKDERRKASVKFLARKTPLYENIEMYAPDGTTMLCTIGKKKANWYVRKELAVWLQKSRDFDVDEEDKGEDKKNETPSIRLLFEPKNHRKKAAAAAGERGNESCDRSPVNNDGTNEDDHEALMRKYNCTHKLNICVSCGAIDATALPESNNSEEEFSATPTTTGLMRHYVVPYAYRRLLPKKFKTHLPHDVVLLCLDCHIDAEQAAKTLRTDVYEELYRKDPDTRPMVVIDREIKAVKSRARALWQHREKLPPSRVEEYEARILEYLARTNNDNNDSDNVRNDDNNEPNGLQQQNMDGASNTTTTTIDAEPAALPPAPSQQLSEAVLRDLSLHLETEQNNPNYVPLASVVVEHLCRTDEEIQEFVVGWRQFFVETLQPRHLPLGWRVDSPVRVDVDVDVEEDVEKEG